MTTDTLTTSVHDALNRCRAGLLEVQDLRQDLSDHKGEIAAKRKALNKQARELREREFILLINWELLYEINTVLADAVVTADKEAKQAPAEVDPLGR